ncbi:MAG TPA: hypothetical protein PK668_27115 [Myxococcota bacterium]|nr:hypothetical protein [Myxococcota bacterium]HRY97200.1 hypothetical protein [Myxococcota bacterium]HSA21348.1 hypothetical protein [Myxococcota bacterium]
MPNPAARGGRAGRRSPAREVRLRALGALLGACLLSGAGPVRGGEDACASACLQGDPAAVEEAAACLEAWVPCLLERDGPEAAVEALKALRARGWRLGALERWLAYAYLREGNLAWAVRTLHAAVEREPGDCASRELLAWALSRQGFVDLAREALAGGGCPRTEAGRGRALLLEALWAQAAGDAADGLTLLRQARRARALGPGDRALLRELEAGLDPSRRAPLELRAELQAGYSTNATAGAPSDPGAAGPASGLARMDLGARLELPEPGPAPLRPSLEARLQGNLPFAGEASGYRSLELDLRPGVRLGQGRPSLLVAYQHQKLWLDQQAPLFSTGHRLELELESGALLYFAGLGRRLMRDAGRTRTELDGGLGGALRPLDWLELLLAGSFRYHAAEEQVWDLWGLTGIASARAALPADLSAQLALTAGLDHYPRSGGEAGRAAFGSVDERLDLFARVGLWLWSPAWLGGRLGAGYELSWRDSSADTVLQDHDFVEHRLLVGLRWSLELDPFAPPEEPGPGAVPLAREAAAVQEAGRLQELLRQDEFARRDACGCGH